MGSAGGFRREVQAFAQRWVYGRGCPHLTAAFTYNKKGNNIEMAVRQSGSVAALRGAERSVSASGDASSVALLRVCLLIHLPHHRSDDADVLVDLSSSCLKSCLKVLVDLFFTVWMLAVARCTRRQWDLHPFQGEPNDEHQNMIWCI